MLAAIPIFFNNTAILVTNKGLWIEQGKSYPPKFTLKPIPGFPTCAIKKVTTEKGYLLVLFDNGTIFGGGTHNQGCLEKDYKMKFNVLTLTNITGLPGKVMDIASGALDSFLLLEDGSIWTYGSESPAAQANAEMHNPFTKITSLTKKVSAIACGTTQILALNQDGSLLKCQVRQFSEQRVNDMLVMASTLPKYNFTPLPALTAKVKAIACDNVHASVLLETNILWKQKHINTICAGKKITRMIARDKHVCVILNDNSAVVAMYANSNTKTVQSISQVKFKDRAQTQPPLIKDFQVCDNTYYFLLESESLWKVKIVPNPNPNPSPTTQFLVVTKVNLISPERKNISEFACYADHLLYVLEDGTSAYSQPNPHTQRDIMHSPTKIA